MSGFTEEMIVALHHLWDEQKLSAAECGAQLRKRFILYPGVLTRNAILGVLARARAKAEYQKPGWFEERTRAGPHQPVITTQNKKPIYEGCNTRRSKYTGQSVPTPLLRSQVLLGGSRETKVAFAPTEVKPITIMELTSAHCKWPMDVDGQIMYCGAPRIAGRKPYCYKHARM